MDDPRFGQRMTLLKLVVCRASSARPSSLPVETAETAAAMMDEDLDEICTTRGHPGRAIIAHLARIESLSRLREIAALLGLRSYGHVSTLVKRVETDRNRIPGLARLIDSCTTTLRARATPSATRGSNEPMNP